MKIPNVLADRFIALSWEEQNIVINALRNGVEFNLAKAETDPNAGDGFWMARAEEQYAIYRKLGGCNTFNIEFAIEA